MKKLLNKAFVIPVVILLAVAIVVIAVNSYRYYKEINSYAFFSQTWMENEILHMHELFFRENPPTFDDGFGNIIEFPYYDGYSLSMLVHSRWSRAYIFKPGTTGVEIEDVIGFEDLAGFAAWQSSERFSSATVFENYISTNERWRGIPDIVKEGYAQIILIEDNIDAAHGGVIRLSLHANTFYTFDFGNFEDSNYVRILYEDKPRVRVMEKKEDGKAVVRLICHSQA